MRKFSIVSVSMLCLIMLGTLVVVSGCEKKTEPEPTVEKVEATTAENVVEAAKSELETKACPAGCDCAKCQAKKAAEAEIEAAKVAEEAKAKAAAEAKAELEAKAAAEAEKKAEELKESAGSLLPTK